MSSLLKKLPLTFAVAALGLATVGQSQGDTVAWNFGVTASPSASPSTTATNVTASAITRANNKPADPGTNTLINTTSASSTYPGFSAANNAGIAARIGTISTASGGSAYFEFTLTPASGFQVQLTGISFGTRSTNTGPANYSLRSSLDTYGSDVATGSITVSGNPWALKTNTGLSTTSASPITFRLYGYGGAGSPADNTTNWRIDDLSLTVTVSTASADTTPPVLATTSPLSPADNATGVSIGTTLSATFSENIAAGTGNITLYKASDNSVVQDFAVGTSAVTISGSTASFTPTSALTNFTDYYVLIPSGVIVDTAANPFAGITATTAWNFKTIPSDVTPPTIVSVTPTNGATGIAPPTALTVTFSENVQGPLFAGPTIRVKKVSDNSTVATIDPSSFGTGVSVTGAVATIQIPSPLGYGTAYYVEMDADSFEDTSTSNNPFAGFTGSSTWAFTTVDVPSLTTTYTQTFSTFTSATLPQGWSTSGAAGYSTVYRDDWGTTTPDPVTSGATLGGFKGNASVFGYHHTSSSGTVSTGTPLSQILTLRNTTGGVLDNLVVAYKGRTAIPANTRLPAYAVTVNGVAVAALAYSTSDPDNTQRNVSLTGLNIADGATFQIAWSSSYPSAGAGSARQIGISDVAVTVGTATFPPSISGPLIPVPTTGATVADVQANVIGDGGATITDRGFVYSLTNSTPTIGGSGVSQWTDPSPTTGTLNATLTGLTAASTYTIRAYAINANGTTYTGAATFTTLGLPSTLLAPYTQAFNAYLGTNPGGWTAISSGSVQSYASDWNTTTSTGGFSGNVSNPGVLGYRHTGSTGVLTVTLRLINGSSSTLSSLYVKYLGRVFDTANPATVGRSPIWTVAVNGAAAPSLQYSTAGNTDLTVADVITGLSIAPGAEFTITWTSDRGAGSGASKKIGIADVVVGIPSTPTLLAASVTSITSTTATAGSTISADGFRPITARGFVYSATGTNADPLIGGTGVTNIVEGGTTVAAFNSALSGLTAGTGYSLKAYATNSLGTTYTTVTTFTTTAAGGYLTWANAYAPGQAANLDHDNDGVPNGVEYFMGATGSSFTANPGIVSGSVTWPKGATYAGVYGTDFVLQTSTNLTTWTPVSSGSSSLHNTTGSVSYDLPTTPGPFFVRLSVTP